MKLIVLSLILSFLFNDTFAQGNCNMYEGDCKIACEKAYKPKGPQGSRKSQKIFDELINLCPDYAYAHYEKSVPYLKRGLIDQWRSMIDRAVKLEPETYLLNRGCNQIQFFRNYKNGIEDLDRLTEIRGSFNIGFTNSGEYHAQMIRAIAYRKIGDLDKSIEIMEELVNSKWYNQDLYDYLHIGISYLEAGRLDDAKSAFDKQNAENEFAETYYYMAKLFELQGKLPESISMIENAKDLYENETKMVYTYYNYIDKVFLADIIDAQEKLLTK